MRHGITPPPPSPHTHTLFLTFCLRIYYQLSIVIFSCLFPLFNMLSTSIESWHKSVSWLQLEITDWTLNNNHLLKLIYNKWYMEGKDMGVNNNNYLIHGASLKPIGSIAHNWAPRLMSPYALGCSSTHNTL